MQLISWRGRFLRIFTVAFESLFQVNSGSMITPQGQKICPPGARNRRKATVKIQRNQLYLIFSLEKLHYLAVKKYFVFNGITLEKSKLTMPILCKFKSSRIFCSVSNYFKNMLYIHESNHHMIVHHGKLFKITVTFFQMLKIR